LERWSLFFILWKRWDGFLARQVEIHISSSLLFDVSIEDAWRNSTLIKSGLISLEQCWEFNYCVSLQLRPCLSLSPSSRCRAPVWVKLISELVSPYSYGVMATWWLLILKLEWKACIRSRASLFMNSAMKCTLAWFCCMKKRSWLLIFLWWLSVALLVGRFHFTWHLSWFKTRFTRESAIRIRERAIWIHISWSVS
jgi:hypothetical protein